MKTVLGIDLGTQSLKVLFYDFQQHKTIALASAGLSLEQNATGLAEQKAEWWIAALRRALADIDEDVRRSVLGISVSGQQHGFVPVDSTGRVLAPVKLWCDTSTQRECDAIMADFGGRQSCIDKVGNPILTGYTASKIRWLRDRHPDLYAKLDGILLPHDYLNFYLTGVRAMEAGDASGTGFMDIRTRTWSPDMLRAIDPGRDLADCLPDIRWDGHPVGRLLPAVAEELGLPEGTPVAAGGGDNMLGAIGTGNLRPGDMTMSLGTSGTVYACANEPIIDPQGNIAAFCSSTGDWLPLLCTMNCTITTESMRSLLGSDIASFEERVSAAPRGSEGILTLPFFNGERTPNLPNARGCIVGLGSRNMRAENLLRSAVEGATFALKFGIDELARLGVVASGIVLTGGGAKSATWRQVVADVCNAPVVVLEQDEGAAFGAALQALQIVEQGASIEELAAAHLTRDARRSCQPRAAAVNEYRDHYEQYLRAVEAITPLYA